jgi:C-terminal processing protease CtpA/Prc
MQHQFTRALVAAAAILFAPIATDAASSPSPPRDSRAEVENARIERLAGLGRLWGAVKFFHPALAYQDIDWDAALIKAVPRVSEARTPEAYLAAINTMLGELGDPATHAFVFHAQPDPSPVPATGPAYRVSNGVAILNCVAGARLPVEATGPNRAMPSPEELADLRGVVMDCRGASRDFNLVRYLRALVARLADRPVTLGTYRFREHRGYAPQTGITSGGYRSSLVTDAPAIWEGRRKSAAPSLAFIVNAATFELRDLLSGLQAAQLATVIRQSGPAVDAEAFPAMALPDGIVAMIRTTEFVGAGGERELRPDIEISAPATPTEDPALDAALQSLASPRMPPAVDAPASSSFKLLGTAEKPYADMHFPDNEYRLLSLFRLWSVINYFYPYKRLMDRPWSDALVEFVPKFEGSRNELEYQRTVMELAARVQDSHVAVGGARAMEDDWGRFAPPVTVTSIEGKTVVTAVLAVRGAEAPTLQRGDVLVAVDGEPVEQRRARIAPLISASTPQALDRVIDSRLLRGRRGSVARLRVIGADGSEREVDVTRTEPWASVSFAHARTAPATYEILSSGYGYIDLARLRLEDADAAMDAMIDTPGLIFDMRGYPNGTMWPIAPRLAAEGKAIMGAQFRPRFWTDGIFDEIDQPLLAFNQTLPPSGKRHYHGEVVMLINEQAQSQSEHTCLFFAAATSVTFIGTPTAGANGDISSVVLPGQLTVTFTGQEIVYPDGRQLQRIGVQPQIRVAPTVNGIREGRDEILEAAVTFLQQKLKH